MSETVENVVVVHFDEDGEMDYHVVGQNVRLFIVDERAPDDRVYEYLSRDDDGKLRELIPDGSVIGSSDDERHAAISARVAAYREGRPHLSIASVIDG